MIRFKVSAPGKVILYGEHAVVYGKTAIAASVDLRTTLEFEELPANIDELQVCLPKINLNLIIPFSQIRELLSLIKVEDGTTAVDHNLLYNHVQNFVKLLPCVNPAQKLSLEALCYLLISISLKEQLQTKPFRINLSTALSVSSGLGSSASYAVCLSACFLHWSRLQKNVIQETFDTNDLQSISNYAFNCEKIMHGNPSGIDNSVCTFGSVIEFRKDNCFNPIFGVKSMKVLLVDTRVQRNTKKLVGTLAELKQNYPGIIEPILESIDNIAKKAVEVLKKIRELPSTSEKAYFDGYAQLMTLIDINQGLLASCQVSHPSLDRICAEARNYSFAAKLTGAGGGGYAYVLLPPDTQPETISSLSRKLIADGYSVTLTNLGCAGVQVHN